MIFYAHSGTPGDRSDWQRLDDHLLAVERIASEMGKDIGIAGTAALAGCLHDLGKYDPAFDARLRGEGQRVDHSTAGAAVLKDEARTSATRYTADLLAYPILGHHAGLPDRGGASGGTVDARLDGFDPDRLDATWRSEVSFGFDGAFEECLAKIAGASQAHLAFDLSVTVRMIFSCLVDADFRDTERFYDGLKGRSRDRAWPALQDIRLKLLERFETYMRARPCDGSVNALRGDILAHVRAKAALPPGLFTLTVPTGGGKTLASLGFALDHAVQGHRRIIYAIPFTSVIEQTAGVFREVLGAEHVLEHHSAIDEVRAKGERPPEGRDKLRLAMEDWAAPVVVTTNVQLFESLFAARTSRARKLHNIAGSVIVLDEAQTIPRHLLLPCMRMLDALTRHWGCTIVLCTATQPALGKAGKVVPEDWLDLPPERELTPDPPALARRLRRTTLTWAGEMEDGTVLDALEVAPQGLVIVNGRRHALELFREAQARGLEGLMHLTTRRCAADRQGAIREMRRRLEDGAPCRMIATSLIEAGVDVDFPAVWRAEAGLDQIVQAAGRCNREGRRAPEDSVVTVFRPPDHPPPAEIAGLIGDTERMLADHAGDLQSPAAMEAYFEEVFWRIGREGLDKHDILGRFTMGRESSDFAFRSAAADFRMIESGMAPVIARFDAFAERKIRQLSVARIPSGALARALQPYVVQVPPRERDRLIDAGRAVFEAPHLRGDQFAVMTDGSLYDPEAGLIWEDAETISNEDLII
ncbi:CRISPR-associated endonuclease Cas3'' [Jannaschia sp.]|nr:CRISPR-associated endonuclease Cas3'' [Jannaschia sp.]